jgi:hypothetical protein
MANFVEGFPVPAEKADGVGVVRIKDWKQLPPGLREEERKQKRLRK